VFGICSRVKLLGSTTRELMEVIVAYFKAFPQNSPAGSEELNKKQNLG
jgi:hypothetical protein